MKIRTYSSAKSFKQALEQRLRSSSKNGADFQRKRQLLVFDRFLARITSLFGDSVTLKGGLVLELRAERARATKDVDLRMLGPPDGFQASLQQAMRLEMGDLMDFEIAPDPDHPEIQNPGLRYDGFRFRAECRLAGTIYARPFGVDVVFGERLLDEPEVVTAEDLLDFAGIAPPRLRLYPIESHIAEKLHAYTMPRPHPNSRVKDLPDIALLATIRTLDAKRLREAIKQTFSYRGSHSIPSALPDPAANWLPLYAAMAIENELAWRTLSEVTAAAQAFLNPVLRGGGELVWHPDSWKWQPG